MAKWDPSKYNIKHSTLLGGEYGYYYKDKWGVIQTLTKAQARAYERHANIQSDLTRAPKSRNKTGATRNKLGVKHIPKHTRKLFGKYTTFKSKQGQFRSWARPLTLAGGSNPRYNWSRQSYINDKGGLSRTPPKDLWGSHIAGPKNKILTGANVLKGGGQWIRQLNIAIARLPVETEHFRVAVGHRAIAIFQQSFKYKKFNSNESTAWRSLSPATLRKRAKRGTLRGGILREYGDLANSLDVEENATPLTTRVHTKEVPANISHHKKHTICYAGYHNEGVGTYGRGWKGHKASPYIKRQFMGHSSHLNPYTDKYIKGFIKRYLFDSVFLIRKV